MSASGRKFSLLILCVAFATSGCANGGNANAIPALTVNRAAPARAHVRPGRLVLHVLVPKKRRHHRRGPKPRYVSPATQSMTVSLSGPTAVATTAPLTPTSQGCSSGLAGTFCTLTIPNLAPGSYSGSISTWDATGGTGNELSADQNVSFKITTGQSNVIGITLGGIPTSAIIVPDSSSSLTGSVSAGFTLSKCGSDAVSVYGLDADKNIILGAGAPVPSLQSDTPASLAVSTPRPSSPNAFTIVRPSPPPAAASTVHLTATVTPDNDSGADPVSTSAIAMTFNHDICGVVTEFSTGITSGAEVYGIEAGSDGNLWFTELSGGRIARITTSGTVTEYSAGLGNGAEPYQITSGPDGNLWFTACDSGPAVGKITTNGTITEYTSGITGATNGIASGPDGNVWFTEPAAGQIGMITTSGTATEYSAGITSGSRPFGITAGPDGNLWFTEVDGGIGRIATQGTAATEFSSGITQGAQGITTGSDGNLWFAEQTAKIGKITTSDPTITEYTPGVSPEGAITSGPDGNLWITTGDGLARITTGGAVTSFTAGITYNAGTLFITTGPDGNLWFTEDGIDRIGRMQ